MLGSNWIALGAVFAGLSVAAGAFGAHDLNTRLPRMYEGQERVVAGVKIPAAQKYLADFKTAAEYQMFHALALILVGILATARPSPCLTIAGWSFTGGILLFSGCLYALVLTGRTVLGAIVPIGGVLFIVGWVALTIAGISARTPR